MLILFICLFSRLPDISWHAHEQNRGGRKVPADAMWAPPVFTWNTDCSQPWCPLNVSAPFWWLTLHRHGPSVHKQDIHRNNLHILAMKTLLLVICWGFAGSSQTPGQASVMHEETLNWSCGVITVTKPALAPPQEQDSASPFSPSDSQAVTNLSQLWPLNRFSHHCQDNISKCDDAFLCMEISLCLLLPVNDNRAPLVGSSHMVPLGT